MATLCLLDQDGVTAQRWEIGDEPLAVGRDASADVPIEDDALSRRHFIISRAGQGYVVKDLDSQNGTWVDGQQAGTVKLRHHDCILASSPETPQRFARHRRAARRRLKAGPTTQRSNRNVRLGSSTFPWTTARWNLQAPTFKLL